MDHRIRARRHAVTAATMAAAALIVLVLAACGEPAGSAGDRSEPNQGAPARGGPVTVPEALASRVDGPLAVRGYVVARAGRTQLCEALAESYPPQCGGRSLNLDGLDAATLVESEVEQGVRWTSNHVELTVERRGDRFVVLGR